MMERRPATVAHRIDVDAVDSKQHIDRNNVPSGGGTNEWCKTLLFVNVTTMVQNLGDVLEARLADLCARRQPSA
jgi:hypothetical protein